MKAWQNILLEAINIEWESRSPVAALATVDPYGVPHVRHVVCRHFSYEDDSIWIATDSRTDKCRHISENANVELAFWLPKRQEQFRIAATAVLRAGHQSMWDNLMPWTKATFFWPTPGESLEDVEFPATVAGDLKPPPTFELIVLDPVAVDHLQVGCHPHRRRRWRGATNWVLEELNP